MSEAGSVRSIDSTFVWDISDFPNQCKAVGECIVSPCFAAGDVDLKKIKWHLCLYPFGETLENENFLALYLRANFCSDVSEVEILYKFYLRNNNEVNLDVCNKKKFNKKSHSWGYRKFLARKEDKFKNHISMSMDSTLSIACCIKSTHIGSDLNPSVELNQGYLNTFFLSKKLSDVTIEIDNKKLKAHQIILATKSEVFLAMFNHDMKESNERIIKVTDVSYDVMKELLRYIYCGNVENLDLLSRDLLAAADKYCLFSLKRICNEALMKMLNVNNACEIVSIFHLYQCSTYKGRTIDFIIKHLTAVVETEGFKQINDHILLADILRQSAPKITIKNKV